MRTDFDWKFAAEAAKIRRSKRQSKKNFVVCYIIEQLRYHLKFQSKIHPKTGNHISPGFTPLFVGIFLLLSCFLLDKH